MVGVLGFEPRTSSLSGTRSNQLSYTPIQDYQSLSGCGLVKWWSRRDSNPQHPACKAGALAIELRPLAPKSCLPFGHGPLAPASRDRYFSGAPVGHWQPFRLPFPLSGIPCGFAVLMPASLEPFLRNIRSSAFRLDRVFKQPRGNFRALTEH